MTTQSNSTLFIRGVNESYTLDDIWDRIEYFELGQIRKIVLLPVSKMVIYGPNTRNVIVYFDFWYDYKESQYKLSLLLQGKPVYIYYNMISYWTVVAYDAKHKKIAKIRKQKAKKTVIHNPVTPVTSVICAPLVLYNPDDDDAESDNESTEDMYDDICEDICEDGVFEPTSDDIEHLLNTIENKVKLSVESNKSDGQVNDQVNDQDIDQEQVEETQEETQSEQSEETQLEEYAPLPPCKQSRYLDPDCPGVVNTWIDYGNAIMPKPKNRIKRKLVIVKPTTIA